MSFLTWILFGSLVGIIANMIDPRPQEGGLIGSIILGVLGSILGGFIGNLVFGVGINGFDLQSLSIAVLGALFLLFMGRTLQKV
jgi:uncharacterized membrane protein YeaQ/YmgE (transglycosylase-associated protein family)